MRPPRLAGNILDNQELLTTLEGAKSKAVELADKLEVAKATAAEIDDARVRYSPVAGRGAALFFCMAGLAAVNNMYEYSLTAFLGVFNQVGGGGARGSAGDSRLPACVLLQVSPVCAPLLHHQQLPRIAYDHHSHTSPL